MNAIRVTMNIASIVLVRALWLSPDRARYEDRIKNANLADAHHHMASPVPDFSRRLTVVRKVHGRERATRSAFEKEKKNPRI